MSRAIVLAFPFDSSRAFRYLAKRRDEAIAVVGSLVRCDRTVEIRTRNGSPSVESLFSSSAVGFCFLTCSIAPAASRMIWWTACGVQPLMEVFTFRVYGSVLDCPWRHVSRPREFQGLLEGH